MLSSFIAARLAKYIKGCTRENVSAKLFDGKLTLTDVELDLSALADVLVGVLPYTLDLHKVSLKSVSVKVPWQAPRRHPLCVEVNGCEVQIEVHGPRDKEWLASQTSAQHRKLLQGAIKVATETLHEEEEEDDRKELKDVKDKLRVGIDSVIGDGLHFNLRGLKVVLVSADPIHFHCRDPAANTEELALPPMPMPKPLLTVCVGSVSTVPCTRSGVVIESPENAYEAYDTCVRLYRSVEVRGLRIDVVTHAFDEMRSAPTSLSTSARAPPPGSSTYWRPLLVHSDAEGPLHVMIEQKRLSGFIPKHRSRRVCPFSSEAIVNVCIGKLSVPGILERQVLRAISATVDAASPPSVPVEALPPELAHLHWKRSGQPRARNCSRADSMRTDPSSAWEPPTRVAFPEQTQDQVCSPSSGAASPPATADCLRWSEPVAARGVVSGLESREQLADRRCSRLVSLRLHVREVLAELRVAERAVAVFAFVEDVSFSRDMVLALDSFERRCLAELGLAAGLATTALAIEAAVVPVGRQASEVVEAAVPASPSDLESPDDSQQPTPGTPSKQLVEGSPNFGAGGAAHEPIARQPLLCLNALSIARATVWRRPVANFGATAVCFGDAQLLQLRPPEASRPHAVTFRWKELPPPVQAAENGKGLGPEFAVAADPGWQPVEGCIHGLRLVVDVPGWQTIGELLQRIFKVALEKFNPPPLEIGWCRIALHGLELDIPRGAGMQAAVGVVPASRITLPSLLLSSVPGVGQLFCALESVPLSTDVSHHPRAGVHADSPAKASTDVFGGEMSAKESLASEKAASAVSFGSPCETLCACGRELLDGKLKVTNGFVPARSHLESRAWAARQVFDGESPAGSKSGGLVLVSHHEFVELVRSHVAGEALSAVLPQLHEVHSAEGMSDAVGGQPSAGSKPPSPISRRSSVSKLSSSMKRGLGLKQSVSSSSDAGTVETYAKRWAILQEHVHRLRSKRQEVELRCAALRNTSVHEVCRAEAKVADCEREVASQIAQERAKQAALAAKVEDQRRVLDQLLRDAPRLGRTSLATEQGGS